MRRTMRNFGRIKVYEEVSHGKISKINTHAFEVLSEFQHQYVDKDYVKEDIEEIIKGAETTGDLVDELENYIKEI
jgi:hypothetical protein